MDLEINKDTIEKEMEKGDFVLAIVTSTKPDFYKQAPLMKAAESFDVPSFVMHTGQHYDDLLGHGLEEYDLKQKLGANLNIRGGLNRKTAEIMERTKKLAKYLEGFEDKKVLPIVHGDTLAAGIVPQAWMFSTNKKTAHNEAGLRGMTPVTNDFAPIDEFIDEQFNGEWEIDRNEPFPEQYNTFIGSAASQFLFPPTETNKEHLKREGYHEESGNRKNMKAVGNSVVDAIEMKSNEELEESVFDIYPKLEERDDWIRVDIHRRANIQPGRFSAIIEGVVELVERGYNVNFVEMNATKQALDNYGLRKKIERLDKKHENFLFTGLWKKHAHVYEFLKSGKCFAALTDSGSMQEELNHIEETICLTARFNTDRPETVFNANTNLLVPPVSGEFIRMMVEHVYENEELVKRMKDGDKLYGSQVGTKMMNFLIKQYDRNLFEWTSDRKGFHRKQMSSFSYL